MKIVHAAIQVVPVTDSRHPYEWVDEAIEIIIATCKKTGMSYEVGPFATLVEGPYKEVMQLVHEINQHLDEKGCSEWICSLQLAARSGSDMPASIKTAKYH